MYDFFLYEPVREEGMSVLRAVGNVRMASNPASEDALCAEIGDAQGVIVRAIGGMTRRVLEHAPKLKVVGRHGVGVDNIDLVACTEHGVQVVSTPQATIESVAEHTVGMMLDLSKRMTYADANLRAKNWRVRYGITGRELRGRVVGVIGFGRIGRRVAEICAKGFNMQVLYSDVVAAPDLERDLGARKVSMDELLQQAEYITLHVPLMPATTKLIGAREFAMMRKDALFINNSRGPVVDEPALIEALRSGQIAGAGIDVFAQEPTPADNPLLSFENVVVTPHTASSTIEALIQMSLVAEDLVRHLQGEPVKFPVNKLA